MSENWMDNKGPEYKDTLGRTQEQLKQYRETLPQWVSLEEGVDRLINTGFKEVDKDILTRLIHVCYNRGFNQGYNKIHTGMKFIETQFDYIITGKI